MATRKRDAQGRVYWGEENFNSWVGPAFNGKPTDPLRVIVKTVVVMALTMAVMVTIMRPSVVIASASANGAADVWDHLPSELPDPVLPQRSIITDAAGTPIAEFWSEDRTPIPLAQVSPHMVAALISIEDHRFYEHDGVDRRGVARAAMSNGEQGGGSTLTQQYVKNVLIYNATSPEERLAVTAPTVQRKVREARLAMRYEEHHTKDQILESYLNTVYFGQNGGHVVYGIAAASQLWFGVEASQLTIPQAALLAGMIQNPTTHDPVKNPDGAKARRDTVLNRMEEVGRLDADAAAGAKAAPLDIKVTPPRNGCPHSPHPFYCQAVRNLLLSDPVFGPTPEARAALVRRGGLSIRSSLDPRTQAIADGEAKAAMPPDYQYATAVAVVEPGTGRVLGIGQSRTWGQSQVSLPLSGYQNGSTAKPFTLAAAIENGWNINEVMIAEHEFCAPKPNTGCFKNAARWDEGPMNSVDAMSMSSNTFYTQLSVRTGTAKVQQMLRRLGWGLPGNLTGRETSTTLGVFDVSPVVLANAYATFAAHGIYCRPTFILSVHAGGQQIAAPDPACHQEIDPAVADTVAQVLTQVVDGSNPNRTGKSLTIGRPVMGKSGTTEENSSVWFAGGVPQAGVAVWVGDPKGGFQNPVEDVVVYGNRVRGVAGATAAGPVWQRVIAQVAEPLPPVGFPVPTPYRPTRTVPDLRGMSASTALSVGSQDGYSVQFNPAGAPANWVVSSQTRQGNTIVLNLAEPKP